MTKSEASFLNRRRILALGAGFAATSLAACSGGGRRVAQLQAQQQQLNIPRDVRIMYDAVPGEPYPVPAVNLRRLDRQYWREMVPYASSEPAGTIVVETSQRYLYLVRGNGMAMRYGVGIGREGFGWSGKGRIGRKQEWPTWTPPAAMIEREPYLEEFRNGMPPGPENPLGARALYIYQDGRDTLYRIHGNPNEASIGRAVSSGCVRLLQQDIIDLYRRVPVGTDVVVRT